MSNFEFNAPQFVNFRNVDDQKADSFFDSNDHLEQEKNTGMNSSIKTPASVHTDTENQLPTSTVKAKEPASTKKNFTVFRKVLHEIVNHQIQNDKNISNPLTKDQGKDLIEGIQSLKLSEVKPKREKGPLRATEVFCGVKQETSGKKSHPMITRLDTVNQKSQSKQTLSLVDSEDSSEHHVSSTTFSYKKSTAIKRNASPIHNARKFISLAEQVEHFYKDTPKRYRSKPSKETTPIHKAWVTKSNIVPKTPKLTTKYRGRKVNYPDEKQREEMELEEIKKHQVKAHPLNEKILMGPCLSLKAPILKKPVTVPQPFSLTEVKKKEPPPEPVFQFKAQPVPTTILSGCVGVPPKRILSPTVPVTPQIKIPSRLRVEVKSQEKPTRGESFVLPRNTKIEPFSFDTRMRDLLQKKEEFVKKVIEEEKKTFNSFKAHPMPDFKTRSEGTPKVDKNHHKTTLRPFGLTQTKGNKFVFESQNAFKVSPFKARPAAVVHQKPFVPVLQKHEIQAVCEFQLNTEKRATERQKFDEKIKQKEEEHAMILKLQKEEDERLEKERELKERKKTEFKATPMPRYKVFEIHSADQEKLTIPQSPAFSYKTRKANV